MDNYLTKNYNMFIFIQSNFNKNICDILYSELSNHLFNKWLKCDGNILNFISMLDNNNKLIILKWGFENYIIDI